MSLKIYILITLIICSFSCAPLVVDKGQDIGGYINLRASIEQNDINKIKDLLGAGLDVNYVYQDKDTEPSCLLIAIVCNASTNVISYLIDAGADVNFQGRSSAPPLIHAFNMREYKSSVFVVTKLLDSNVDVNVFNSDGITPLMAAADDLYLVEKMLEVGADVNASGISGETCLHAAVLWGKTELALLLLNEGALVDQKNQHGATPLMYAIHNGNDVVANELRLRGAKEPGLKFRFFHKLSRNEGTDDELIDLLAESRMSVNQEDFLSGPDSGNTPLYYAVLYSRKKLVTHLLEMGADVNKKHIVAPLEVAVSRGNLEMAQLLLPCPDAKLNSINCFGFTLLTMAVHNGDLAMVKLLVEHGADLSFVDASGITPLEYSRNRKNSEIEEYLLSVVRSQNSSEDEKSD